MQILCITHADFETPGVIEDWAKQNKHSLKICKPFKGEDVLNYSDSDYDFLILMGGPQSPLHMDQFPYLRSEISLVKKAVDQNKGVLGFCLGAQLIGEAMGASTSRSPHKEIGVFPITLTSEGQKDPLLSGFPKDFPVIHWHNDMPGETSNSVLLAHSEGCPKQILRYGPSIYGFQCHLEITKEGIEKLIQACPSDLKPSQFTQNSTELLQQNYDAINNTMKTILDRFVLALESSESSESSE